MVKIFNLMVFANSKIVLYHKINIFSSAVVFSCFKLGLTFGMRMVIQQTYQMKGLEVFNVVVDESFFQTNQNTLSDVPSYLKQVQDYPSRPFLYQYGLSFLMDYFFITVQIKIKFLFGTNHV